MESSRRSPRSRGLRPCAEGLEERGLMTGGGGSVFAVIPATIGPPGGTVSVPFTIDPGHFTLPRGGMVLGIDVSGQGSPAASPKILAVLDSHGHPLPAAHAGYSRATSKTLGGKAHASAVLFTLIPPAFKQGQPASYTVQVAADGQSSGGLRVGFYLPGDANGDGVVDSKDLQAISSALGARVVDPKYSVDADANRDGHIDPTDLTFARRNLGVKTTITPALTGHPDPADAVDARHRTTTVEDLGFAGTATPGATVTVADTNHRTPDVTATADASGNYRTVLHLAKGTNSFVVSDSDAFGQKNEGVLPGIKYTPPA